MKRSNALMTMMGMAIALSEKNGLYNDTETVRKPLTKEQIQERKRLKQEAFEKKKRDKYGLTEYFYGDNVIYARNKKNANRKARNKGYL